jgi:hypothetical protein
MAGDARLGKAIRCDSSEHRIAQIHPGVCLVDNLASGSSILPLAPKKILPAGMVFRNQGGDYEERPRREYFQHVRVSGGDAHRALQNSYYPRHDRTFGDTMDRFSGALSSDLIGDVLREFTPDMKRFFRRHAPKKVLRIEERLPIPAEDKL